MQCNANSSVLARSLLCVISTTHNASTLTIDRFLLHSYARAQEKGKRKVAQELYCTCQKPFSDDGDLMIGCDFCADWFHFECLGVTEEHGMHMINMESWACPQCLAAVGLKAGAAPLPPPAGNPPTSRAAAAAATAIATATATIGEVVPPPPASGIVPPAPVDPPPAPM
jgi:hypothetical protein